MITVHLVPCDKLTKESFIKAREYANKNGGRYSPALSKTKSFGRIPPSFMFRSELEAKQFEEWLNENGVPREA